MNYPRGLPLHETNRVLREQRGAGEKCVLDDLESHCPDELLALHVREWPQGLTALEIHRVRDEWCDTVTLRGTREAIGTFLATHWYGSVPHGEPFNGDIEGYTYDMSRIREDQEVQQS